MQTGFYISTDKSKLEVEMIAAFLSNRAYWAMGRTRESVERSITHSTCFGLFNSKHQQVGFARVVTDFTIFAWLMDVFVLEDYRGCGLGKMLINAIFSDPELKEIKRWGLGTRDAHDFYRQFGFKELEKPGNMMERVAGSF